MLIHLWQSTVFLALAGFAALALSRHHARVRYWIWFAASVKFLVPFALLVSVGNRVQWRTAEAGLATPAVSLAQVVIATSNGATRITTAPPLMNDVTYTLFGLWLCGFLVSAAAWARQWLQVRATLNAATPAPLDLPIPAMMSRKPIEPGVFGVLKPVLLLPAGITECLTPAQFSAIIAHELCHVRRRDNLTAAIHMLVETIYWFFPPLWFIRERLVEERERACDEEVLRTAGDPESYAAGILSVCRHYLAAPACVSGVGSANLKERITAIMTPRVTRDLNALGRALLSTAAVAAIVAPIALGVWNAPPARAQSLVLKKRLAFEVASIKPSAGDVSRIRFDVLPGGKLSAQNVPLKAYIAGAYNTSPMSKRVSSGPDWINDARFDIEATPEKGAIPPGTPKKVSDKMVMSMLRTLLEDRFHLEVHTDTKETPVYEMVVAKGGVKLEASKLSDKECEDETNPGRSECHTFNGGMGRGLHAKGANMADLAQFIENWSDRLILDRTGISGLYVFETSGWQPIIPRQLREGEAINPAEGDLNDPARPTLFMVLDRLGLRLVPQKSPVDVFIIDHVEKPVAN